MIHNFGDIINQLKGSVEYYNAQKSITDNLLRQRSSLPNLSIDIKGEILFNWMRIVENPLSDVHTHEYLLNNIVNCTTKQM